MKFEITKNSLENSYDREIERIDEDPYMDEIEKDKLKREIWQEYLTELSYIEAQETWEEYYNSYEEEEY